ncbi:Spermidine/spermine N(1)-acetyltransferase [Polaribacter huanghezhanensis]|uniref:GNAT family N-acetyltransferase n=1 Tax=Polaribacter huanghezhanensis TaxID=1354726 RepID=UPI0026488DD2|nr:GNAT family N-acetyltransferase [Polaribacter huanghezhanensis]WKD84801.1 Spermidine/spermine N(1)-acetyltransferase [Polaribacter huanghezhanensis]
MQIREANTNDAAMIAELAITTFDETFGHLFEDRQILLDYFSRTFSEDKMKNSIQKENNVFWLAFVDENPVGYAKLKVHSPSEFVTRENVSQLQKIYVLKEFLSMKIGLKLQKTVLQKAADLGSKQIWLSVYVDNLRAINFYLKNGFEKVGEHQFQIGKYVFDFIAMNKSL